MNMRRSSIVIGIVVIVILLLGTTGCCKFCKTTAPPPPPPPPSSSGDIVIIPLPDNPIKVGPGNAGAAMSFKENNTTLSGNPFNVMRDDMTLGAEWVTAELTTGQAVNVEEAKFTVKVMIGGELEDVEVEFFYDRGNTNCMTWSHDRANVQIGTCDADIDVCRWSGIPAIIYGELNGMIEIKEPGSSTWKAAKHFTIQPKAAILGCE